MSDIALLFARDPLKMSDSDIDQIIEAMRAKRHLFNSAPAGPKPKLTKAEAEVSSKLSNIDLDLGL